MIFHLHSVCSLQDPTSALLQLAEHTNMRDRFHALSLGQGQAPIAKRMFKEGVREGHWVFLANCHLSLSWMPELDKLVEQLQVWDSLCNFSELVRCSLPFTWSVSWLVEPFRSWIG